MTTVATIDRTGPVNANGLAPIPFYFQAISAAEVGVMRGGVEQIGGFSVTLNGDSTGSITPTSDWGADEIIVFSKPNFEQRANFGRFAAFFPDQMVPPLDRLARQDIALAGQKLDKPLDIGVGGFPAIAPDGTVYMSQGTGADAGLRGDLAGSAGAEHIGTPSGTVADDLIAFGIRADHLATGADVSAAFGALFDQAEATGRALVIRKSGSTINLASWTAKTPASRVTIIGQDVTITSPAAATDFCQPTAPFHFEGVTFSGWKGIVNATNRAADLSNFRLLQCKARNGKGIQVNVESIALNYLIDHFDVDGLTRSDGGDVGAVRIGWDDFASEANWQGRILWLTAKNITQNNATQGSAYGYLVNGTRTAIFQPRVEAVTNNCAVAVGISGAGCYGGYTKLSYSVTVAPIIYQILSPSANLDTIGLNQKGGDRAAALGSPEGIAHQVIGGIVKRVGTAGVSGAGGRIQSDDQKFVHTTFEDTGLCTVTIDEGNNVTPGELVDGCTHIGTGTVGERGILVANGGQVKIPANNQFRNIARPVWIQSPVAMDAVDIGGFTAEAPAGITCAAITISGASDLTNLSIGPVKLKGTWTFGISDGQTGAPVRAGWKIDQGDIRKAATPASTALGWPTDLELVNNAKHFRLGPTGAHTGDTVLSTLGTITLPANIVGKNGQVVAEAYFKSVGVVGGKTSQIRFGGTIFSTVGPTGATSLGAVNRGRIMNNGATNAQISAPASLNGFGSSTITEAAAAVDTTAAVAIDFMGQLAAAADSIELRSALVTVYERHF